MPAREPAPGVPQAWKNEVTERLRAHRTRRPRIADNQPSLPGMEAPASSSIAARVAERYARVPSYREMLAAQAAAKAAAEAAAQAAAQAAAEAAAAALLSAASSSNEPLWNSVCASVGDAPEHSNTLSTTDPPARPVEPAPQPWQPELIRYSVSSDSLPAPRCTPVEARAQIRSRAEAAMAQSAEALLDPLAEALVEPASPLPARVIQFPRELVAPRKARPRLAEGPLREDESPSAAVSAGNAGLPSATAESGIEADSIAGAEALRIFEAEPELHAGQRDRQGEPSRSSMPEWYSIQLDAERSRPESRSGSGSSIVDGLQLHVASLQDRAMAAVVDVALTLAAFLAFVLVFAVCTTHLPGGRVAAAGSAISLAAMWILYQFVFFGLSDATPGMRYARIALCTFNDENPTRSAMRGRIAALLLSALPLGLGFLWAAFDEDTLGWHDRITQTYQRSYRDL